MVNTHVIHFHCNITPQSVEALRNHLYDIVYKQKNGGLIIELSSLGGDIPSGFLAYQMIRNIPAKVTIVAINVVESMAVVMMLAAQERVALIETKFKTHPLTTTFHTEDSFRYDELKEVLDGLKFDIERYADVFKKRTSLAKVHLDIDACLAGTASTFDTNTAMLYGIIDRVAARISEVYAEPAVHYWVNA